MPNPPVATPDLSPLLKAGLLLVAIPMLEALGLPHPTGPQMFDATGASKTRSYALRKEILAILPSLLRPPGRPTTPPVPRTDTSAISRAMLAFVQAHPGSCCPGTARTTYSDGFRHRVIELAEQHPDLEIAQIAEAVCVPSGTVQEWLATPVLDATPVPPTPVVADLDDARNAQIASIVHAWRAWDGGFAPFCTFVRAELGIPHGEMLIRSILDTHCGRRPERRPGRASDEKAMRNAMISFFPGAQWFEDGSPIAITLNGRKFTSNWELCVDGWSGAFVGCSVHPEETAAAVVAAFEDGVVTTGAKPLALNTDNRASNHTPEVATALGDTLHIRTTLGRPQTDAPVEGAFGLFQQTCPPLIIDGHTDEEIARAVLALILTVWGRATNHRPRNDRNGRSRIQLYRDQHITTDQIAAAKAQLVERYRRQELAFQTRHARLNPVVRALLDAAFDRLGFDDPNGNNKDAIAGYPLDSVLAGIATFDGKRDAGTLPDTAGPRYLLAIIRNITVRDEGLAIARQLWERRLEAGDRAMVGLDEARKATQGTVIERLRVFVDRALSEDGPLLRGFWLAAAADAVLAAPLGDRKALYEAAVRRICGTFAVEARERQAAVRVVVARVLAVA